MIDYKSISLKDIKVTKDDQTEEEDWNWVAACMGHIIYYFTFIYNGIEFIRTEEHHNLTLKPTPLYKVNGQEVKHDALEFIERIYVEYQLEKTNKEKTIMDNQSPKTVNQYINSLDDVKVEDLQSYSRHRITLNSEVGHTQTTFMFVCLSIRFLLLTRQFKNDKPHTLEYRVNDKLTENSQIIQFINNMNSLCPVKNKHYDEDEQIIIQNMILSLNEKRSINNIGNTMKQKNRIEIEDGLLVERTKGGYNNEKHI